MLIKKNTSTNKGFTLIELMVYIGLVVIIGTFLSSSIFYLSNTNFIAFTSNETLQNGREAMEVMTRYIHKADSVTIPAAAGATSNSLTLVVNGSNVVFSVSPQGRLQIQEGVSSPVNITDNKVNIGTLTFKRVQNLSSKPTIQINMETRYIGTVTYGPNPTYNLKTTVGIR